MKFCKECGSPLNPDSKFCKKCGVKITKLNHEKPEDVNKKSDSIEEPPAQNSQFISEGQANSTSQNKTNISIHKIKAPRLNINKNIWLYLMMVIMITVGTIYFYNKNADGDFKAAQTSSTSSHSTTQSEESISQTSSISEISSSVQADSEEDQKELENEEIITTFDSIQVESISESSTADSGVDITETNKLGRVYTVDEKRAILQEFIDWASYRAEIGGMVVSDYYLGHGASGFGDWYANTENGEMQIQDVGNGIPGYNQFPIHLLGGVVFYTSIEELYGYDSRPEMEAIAAGFHRLADPSMPVTRYLLGDDGIIYELQGTLIELGSFHGGYGLYEEDGSKSIDSSSYIFKISEDTDAQERYTEILSKYN